MRMLPLLLALWTATATAAPSDSGPLFPISDKDSNGITSQANGSKQALDIGIDVAGVQVDPRTRTWSLSSGSDSCSAVQSGTWNITNITGTVPLPPLASTSTLQSSTITAIQETHGTVTPGTVATKSDLIGGQYNTTPPTLTNGQQVALQMDSHGALMMSGSTTLVSPLPAATVQSSVAIASGAAVYTSYTATQKLAVKQFYAGGTGIGKQTLYTSVPSATVFEPGGDFETNGDVALWPYFSSGGGGTGTAALSTAQFNTGTHSVAVTFTTSAANNSNGLRQTFSPVADFSGYRYISAYFYNTLSAGGAYTRTISIVLTDSGGNTRLYTVSGPSTTTPFNTAGWINILGDQKNPSSTTGTAFDQTSIASVELRMFDSGNKAGTVYWDTVKLIGSITSVFPIFHQANSSFNVTIDPVVVLNIGDQVLIEQINNDTTRKEFFALAGAVAI